MPWEMKKLHHWYMQAAKERVSMIPLRLCSINQRKTHLHTREFWKLAYLNPQMINQTAINPRLNTKDPRYADKMAAECYKQPKGSVHCGYYTCIFSQSSSKYLDCIIEESKEERRLIAGTAATNQFVGAVTATNRRYK
ncbi:hypothetical protein EJB05_35213, partial [Eragrostis curvula]